jgi:PAS domain S-box-containing protein
MAKKQEEIERERIKVLQEYQILDTPEEKIFDDLAKIAAFVCKVPYAFISMIDRNRQWHKAKVGSELNNTPRNLTFCTHTIEDNILLEVEDATVDERFKHNPFVQGFPKLRFYAGFPIQSPTGYNVGTVCVVDQTPKKLNDEQREILQCIANQVTELLEYRKKIFDLKESIIEEAVKHDHQSQSNISKDYVYNALRHSVALIEFNDKGKIVNVNQKYLDMFGYDFEELVNKPQTVLVPAIEASNLVEIWKMLKVGEYQSGIFQRKRKQGNVMWIDATYIPVLNDQNKLVRVLKIARDVTKQVEADDQMLKAKQIAEKASIARDNFLANMSHEIRTPMNAILGFTDLLLETEINDTQKDYISSIKLAGKNLLSIINDILDLSKIEAGKVTYEQNEFSIGQILRNIYDILYVKALEKSINLEVLLETEFPKVIIGDQYKLSQILINLIGNAIKFTHQGYVRLSVKVKSQTKDEIVIVFSIQDTGIGIEEDKLNLIFDRFTQANENLTRAYGGTGLGLNISKLLVQRMQGEISVTSVVGKGSEFSFYLPFKISKTERLKKEKPRSYIAKAEKKIKILMCEDNALNQKLAEVVIKQFDMEIDTAENGEVGVELLRKNQYDLILMDLQMPKMDGYQTTQYIRKELKLDTPIIAITAHSLPGEKDKCIACGMNDYISKPFVKQELHEKIIKLTH